MKGEASAEHTLDVKRRAAYEKLCNGVPDALFVLARYVKSNPSTGEIQSGSYSNIAPQESTDGGKARSIAAAQLHHAFPESMIVTNSRVTNLKVFVGDEAREMDVNLARIMSQEVQRRGVEPDRVVLQEESISTFTELLELMKLITERNWRHVAVIANEYQIPRAEAMLEKINDLNDPGGFSKRPDIQQALHTFNGMRDVKISFVSAEDVLIATDRRYAMIIDEARKTDLWQATAAREKEGARQVLAGEYWKQSGR